MVLEGGTMYTFFFAITFFNNRSIGLKFWYHVSIYKGHIWYEFQHPATLIVEVTMLLCVFKHFAKFAHVATMGLQGPE